MKKKILHVLNSSCYSGAENIASMIIKNFESNFIMAYASLEGPIKKSLEDRNIEFISLEKLSLKKIRQVIDKWKPDIIHAHDFTATVICAFATKKIPVISQIHQNPKWLDSVNAKSLIFKLASTRIQHIVVVSDSIEEAYIMNKYLRDKITVIENIGDIKWIKLKSNEFDYDGYYDLIFIGRLTDIKNPLRFIDIVSNVVIKKPDLKVCIIGDGELRNECEKKVNELKIVNNVDFKGFLNNPFPILKRSKILVMTSKSEGLPMTAIEALSLKKPLIVSNIDGINKIVDSNCGIICNDDNEFINGIIDLIDDPYLYNKLSENAGIKAEILFSMEKYLNKFKKIYQDTIFK